MPLKRRGRPTLPPGQVRRVRAALRRMLRENDGNCAEVGRLLGISQSAVHQINSEHNKPSRGTAERIARVQGIAVEVLLTGAHPARVSARTKDRKAARATPSPRSASSRP